jgi:trimeric autotransporter adhesin
VSTATAVSAATEAAATAVSATEATTAAAVVSTAAGEAATTTAVVSTGATNAHRVGRSPTSERMSTTCIAGSAASIGVTGASIAYSAAVIAYTTAIARSAVVSTVAIIPTATIVATATPVAVIPRASADKEATDEPARAVVAIRSACVGIVVVIPPRAYGSRIPIAVIAVSWSNPNPDSHLGIGGRSKE